MTWEEKLAAIQQVSMTTLRLLRPGEWLFEASQFELWNTYSKINAQVNLGGVSPEEVVTNAWSIITDPVYAVSVRSLINIRSIPIKWTDDGWLLLTGKDAWRL